MNNNIKDFEFEFIESGEHCFVETDTLAHAYEIFAQYDISKNEVEYCGWVDVETAEILGYDTY